jgi:3-deoxy-D-manno-octulosonic-acid transferase
MALWLLCNAVAAFAAVMFAPIWIAWVRATPRHRRTFLQRAGVTSGPVRQQPAETKRYRLWVHALSVGEVLASRALVEGLLVACHDVSLTFTASTLTGFQTAERIFSDPRIQLAYYPLDWIVSIHEVAKRIEPDAVILVETDLWPNFLIEMHRRGVPVYLVNMRLSDSSFRTYRRIRWVARRLLGALEVICVQTRRDRIRLEHLGVDPNRVIVTGNIKFDDGGPPHPDRAADLWPQLAVDAGSRQVIVAGSTHEGEEAALLEAFEFVGTRHPAPLLIIAPRNPDRSGRVLALCTSMGHNGCRLSRLSEVDSTTHLQVVVVDFIGALKTLYQLADIAFIGGSLIPEGGHNPLEPAACGKPVVFGPDMRDFRQIADLLNRAGGARQIASARQLGPLIVELLDDTALCMHMGKNARDVFLSHKGAVKRTLACLDLAAACQSRETNR